MNPIVSREPESPSLIKTVTLDPFKRIASIRAGVVSNCAIKSLTFLDSAALPIASLGVEENTNPQEVRLDEGESIIGLFGVRKPANVLYGLGFIVWRPAF